MKTYQEISDCKEARYKTAKAIIGCAWFKAGDFVSVKYMFHDSEGQAWFEAGSGRDVVAYPARHLTRFCL